MSHPSLGLPPRDERAGFPNDAKALRSSRLRTAARALEAAIHEDPTLRERHSDLVLRGLLADLEAMTEVLATSVAAGDPRHLARWADMVAVRYRKRAIPLDDVISLLNGLRQASASIVEPEAMPTVDAAIDAAIAVFRDFRRLAGDARKRHPLLAFLYKGA
ncbi:MAG TPA: hypothetical protein VEX41_11055 [Candidatus Eisenbacteria bacterium]|nr:hypothetical protein [Candidatus Eisenbacteria bacterium]